MSPVHGPPAVAVGVGVGVCVRVGVRVAVGVNVGVGVGVGVTPRTNARYGPALQLTRNSWAVLSPYKVHFPLADTSGTDVSVKGIMIICPALLSICSNVRWAAVDIAKVTTATRQRSEMVRWRINVRLGNPEAATSS